MERALTCLIELNRSSSAPERLYRAASRLRRCSSVCLLHVVASGRTAEVEAGQRVLRDARRALHRLAPRLAVVARLEIGEGVARLLSVAEEIGADVMVMDAHGDGEFPRVEPIGRQARMVLEQGRRPVLLVSPVSAALRRPRRSGSRWARFIAGTGTPGGSTPLQMTAPPL